MLAVGVLLALTGVVATLPRALRVRRRALGLRTELLARRVEVDAALAGLAAGRAETAVLLRPWFRIWRWSRHPLVGALLEWSLRRRRRVAITAAAPAGARRR